MRRKRTRLPRQLKTTREGKLLIAITLGLGFGAINSGNNLLYLILGMLLSMIVVSGVLSEFTLRGLRVSRRYEGAVHAGRDTFLALDILNTKRRQSSFSVEIDEVFDAEANPGGAGDTQRPGYALVVKPGERQTISLRCRFARRGVFTSTALRVATRFPFSFFRKSREFREPFEFLVYPEVRPVLAPRLGMRSMGSTESDRRVGRGGDYHGLREHQIDDDPRDIHWKTSARLGRLVSREYERSADRRLWIICPNLVDDTAGSAAEQEAALDFDNPRRVAVERTISEAASLAAHYLGAGWSVGLRTLDGLVAAGTGPGQLTKILAHLARAPVHRVSERSGAAELGVPSGSGDRLLVSHPEQGALPLSGGWDHAHQATAADGAQPKAA